jgi:hypothetical protein
MKRLLLLATVIVAFAAPAHAASFYILGSYARPSGDSDIFEQNKLETTFQDSDLNDLGFTAGYDHFLTDNLNLGGSVSLYNSDTRVQDVDFEFPDGDPIVRTIEMQVIPVEFNVRFLPAGREQSIIPYVGGGVGAYFWEYEERGDFVINRGSNTPRVRTGSAFSDGIAGGWHVEGGIHVPFSRSAALAAEVKYFDAKGDLDPEGFDPAFEPIDLSQTVFSGGISFWF